MNDIGLILDFDGTILDTEAPVYQSWLEVWASFGEELLLTDWQGTIGTKGYFDPSWELEKRIGRQLGREVEQARLRRCADLQRGYEVRPGVMAWLEEAERLGIPVGIASSSSAEWVEDHLERLELTRYFRIIVCAGDIVPVKPDPTSYTIACTTLGVDPGESIAVEDSPHGIAAARAAGLFAVAIPHPLTSSLDLSTADLIRDSLERLTLSEVIATLTTRRRGGT